MKLLLFTFFLLYAQSCFSQNPTYKNIVFEGGGIRGVAYAGALQELQKYHLLDSIERAAGSSAGGVVSALYAVDYTPDEMLVILSELNFKKFNDGKGIFIGGTKRFIKKFGWYRGDRFLNWAGRLIEAKTGNANLTFKQLHDLRQSDPKYKDLYITGTNLSKQKTIVFSFEKYPDMPIKNAVRISMGIPFYFQAVKLDSIGNTLNHKSEGDIFIDGGVLKDFPIDIFDQKKYLNHSTDTAFIFNNQTIGLRLDREEQINYDQQHLGLAPYEIDNFKDYIAAFYGIVKESLNRNYLKKEDWSRTISINTMKMSPKIKKLSTAEKDLLVGSGVTGAQQYLKRKHP